MMEALTVVVWILLMFPGRDMPFGTATATSSGMTHLLLLPLEDMLHHLHHPHKRKHEGVVVVLFPPWSPRLVEELLIMCHHRQPSPLKRCRHPQRQGARRAGCRKLQTIR